MCLTRLLHEEKYLIGLIRILVENGWIRIFNHFQPEFQLIKCLIKIVQYQII